jgi:predicted tellurium resistance membrane protein TerC
MDLILSVLGLTALQIVLGIDNVIFLSIVTSELETDFKNKARRLGIIISMFTNTILILCAGFLANIKTELFSILGKPFNVHDLIMIGGGFFLVYKATKELYHAIEQKGTDKPIEKKSMLSMILTMTMIDFIFSIDSTITAIGMSEVRWIQLTSTLTAVLFMFFFFKTLNNFIEKHPSFKILALSFLVMIGFSLFVDGMGIEIPKAYVYSMMVFAILMETINIRFDKNVKKEESVEEDKLDELESYIREDLMFELGNGRQPREGKNIQLYEVLDKITSLKKTHVLKEVSVEEIFDMLPNMVRYENGKLMEHEPYFLNMHKSDKGVTISYKSNGGATHSMFLGQTSRRGKNLREAVTQMKEFLEEFKYS